MKELTPPEKRYTAAEISQLYNIPKWKIWAAAREGFLPKQKLLNGRIYFRLSDVEAAFTLCSEEVGHGE